MSPLLLTIPDAAKALACSERLIEKLISAGELPSVRLGKRARRIVESDLREYVLRLRNGEGDDGRHAG